MTAFDNALILGLYPRVSISLKAEDGTQEAHVFDRSRLMYSEVAEIQKVTGLSYGDWEQQLAQFGITAVAALLHVLRKRDGMPSEFATMQFNAASVAVAGLKEDGTEYTQEEAAAELVKRVKERAGEDAAAAGNGAGPTPSAAATVAPETGSIPDTTSTSLPSPANSASGRGNGKSSHGRTSASARATSTPS